MLVFFSNPEHDPRGFVVNIPHQLYLMRAFCWVVLVDAYLIYPQSPGFDGLPQVPEGIVQVRGDEMTRAIAPGGMLDRISNPRRSLARLRWLCEPKVVLSWRSPCIGNGFVGRKCGTFQREFGNRVRDVCGTAARVQGQKAEGTFVGERRIGV